jgi:hypothetical protein
MSTVPDMALVGLTYDAKCTPTSKYGLLKARIPDLNIAPRGSVHFDWFGPSPAAEQRLRNAPQDIESVLGELSSRNNMNVSGR